MLKISNLSVKYDDSLIIEDLNIALSQAEILTLVGPTGCGKTTVLRAIAGLVPISAGQIEFDDWCATSNNRVVPEKRHLGMVFQDFALFPHLTVEQNIGFKLNSNEQVDHWMTVLGLEKFRKSKPSNLSGGQKQRVALARTLAHQPNLVLLDEPLSNLDAALKDDLRWEIRDALKTANVPAIWVTHDQEEALSVGDRVGILKAGKLEQLDTPEVCYTQPENKFVASFLGEASFINTTIKANDTVVDTEIGKLEVESKQLSGEVSLMLRPHDIAIAKSQTGNGKVVVARYDGVSRFYKVQLESGTVLKVRTNCDQKFDIQQSVEVNLVTDKPLVCLAD